MRELALRLVLPAMGKGGETVMAMFFAQRVILGKTRFADVPAKLQAQVRELLCDAVLAELCE